MPKETEAPDPVAAAILALAESIKAGQTNGADSKLASIEKFLVDRENSRPQENHFNPPMISALNPLGERDHPRPELKCRMIWVGYKLSKDCCTREEIELLNDLEAGEYRVTKSDGKSIPFRVTPKIADNGKLEHLSIHFPCKSSEDRHNHLSMTAYLRQALGRVPDEMALRAQVEALKAQLGKLQAQ